ncbi:cytochrome P450 [Streptomyces palmae]|uniref:Cytochrome P450 n=1 Tax=Streptomyces palmae TaxID=1701085 RepID=A0A4Z0HEY6_9ACTN|nr:cytochrome P450 [Streptomyces palmae]TGB14857.1 cytochrome P450 [Streptomyces palmae]
MIPVLDLFQISSGPDAERELGRLARRHPVIRTRQTGGTEAWTVLSAPLVRQLLADSRVSNELHPHAPHAAQSPDGRTVLFEQDGSEHARYRKLVGAAFNSRAVRRLEARVVDIARRLLDRLGDAGTADFLEEFANPLPLEVICELLGVPVADRAVFKDRVENVDSPHSAVRQAALDAFLAYCGSLVEAKRGEPTEDLLSELVTATFEDGTALTDLELVGFCSVLLFAGHVTTAYAISSTLVELITHEDQLAALRADPAKLAAAAAEEGLRYRGSLLATTNRVALCDIEVGGVRIRRGELVRFLLSAANWDPAVRAAPDTFDIDRATPAHLAFGHGPHFCLGQRLARQEITVALSEIATRFTTLELAVPREELRWRTSDSLRGLTGLPLRYGR